MAARGIPEVFLVAPYYKNLKRLKNAAYSALKHSDLKPILAEHDLEAELRWKRITKHIRQAKYVVAVFAATGGKKPGSPNIAIEAGYALAKKSAKRVGLFCRKDGRKNPLCFPSNLDGFDPVEFATLLDLDKAIRKWVVKYCPDRNERMGQESESIDKLAAKPMAGGVPDERARAEVERRLRILKRGGLASVRLVQSEVRKKRI